LLLGNEAATPAGKALAPDGREYVGKHAAGEKTAEHPESEGDIVRDYAFSDLKTGHQESFSVTLSDEMMEQFKNITGDINPLHLDAEYARKAGFPDRVVYGLLTASFYSTLVGVYLPGKYALFLGAKKMNFHRPVFVGDRLTVTGTIANLNEAFKVIEIKATIVNQRSELVSDASLNASSLK